MKSPTLCTCKGQHGNVGVTITNLLLITGTGRGFTCPYAGLRNSIDSLNSSSAPAGAAQHDFTVNGCTEMTTQLS